MIVLNVNNSLGLKTGGGTAERTFQMSRHLALANVKTMILTLDIELEEDRIRAASPASVTALPCLNQRFYIPRGGWKEINRLVDEADVVHLMGHWSVLNALVYLATRRARKPYVVSPAGALPLFGRSKWIKRLFNCLIGGAIVRNASGWIAVTKGEFPQFEKYGIEASQIVVIPNGVSKEDFEQGEVEEFIRRKQLPHAPIVLFMGRLNPIKGPDLLLKAFLTSRLHFPSVHLVFVGPDDGMLTELREMVAAAEAEEFVHFLGYLGGADKSAAYHMAKLLVVPSRQEAMSIVAIEAGFCGLPTLLTDQCGFSDIRTIDTRLEVPAEVEGIADGMKALLTNPTLLAEIAPVWENFVKQRYSWPSLVGEYQKLYSNILANFSSTGTDNR